jgi:hypothetical protein
MIIAVDVVALYGLCAHGSRETWPPLCADWLRWQTAVLSSGEFTC